MPIRVLVYEDNEDLLKALTVLFATDAEFHQLGGFSTAVDCVAQAQALAPDVVIMDIDMPGITGVEAVKRIKQAAPAVRVIMHTVFEDGANLFRALENGASGYILKRGGPLKIIEACKEAYAGGAPITPLMASMILKRMAGPVRQEHGLREREKEVLSLLVEGHSYKTIATALFISVDTVRSHIRSIYEKLHVHSKGEAVARALRDRIV